MFTYQRCPFKENNHYKNATLQYLEEDEELITLTGDAVPSAAILVSVVFLYPFKLPVSLKLSNLPFWFKKWRNLL